MSGFGYTGFGDFNMFGGFGGFDFMFSIVFFLIFGMVIFVFVQGIIQWNKNNHSPRLTVDATVVAKRTSVTHHHHENHMSHSTNYYVTFQVESGDRMEFHVNGSEYGILAEGDYGDLSFQGTRYIDFMRK